MLLMGGGYFLLDSSHITIMYADWGGEGRGYEAVQYNQSDLAIANSVQLSQEDFDSGSYTMGCTTVSDNGRYIFNSYGTSSKFIIDTTTKATKKICEISSQSGDVCDVELDLGDDWQAFGSDYSSVSPIYISDDADDLVWASSLDGEKAISILHNNEFSMVYVKDITPTDILQYMSSSYNDGIITKSDNGWYYSYTYTAQGENEIAGQYNWVESITIALDDNFNVLGSYKQEASSNYNLRLYSSEGEHLYEMQYMAPYEHYEIVHIPPADGMPDYDDWQATTIPANLKVNTYKLTIPDNGGDEDNGGEDNNSDDSSSDDIEAPNTGFKNN